MSYGAWRLLLAAVLLTGTGCQHFPWWRPKPAAIPCTFDPGATKQEIVAHVNRFIAPEGELAPLTSWRATQMKVTMSGAPPLGGTIDVQAPTRLRIRAEVPITNFEMADFGSNGEDIWFWGKGAPAVVAVSHEDLPYALQQMQIPFEPEWLMEVLGVVPINVEEYELIRPTSDASWIDLVARRKSPSGEQVVRVVRVDMCHGHIVEQRVQTLDGELIASARLGDYKPDVTNRYVLPHLVHLEWPVTETSLTLQLGAIHANPVPQPETAWAIPHKAGVPIQRLAAPPGSAQAQRTATRQQLFQPILHQSLASPQEVFSEDFTPSDPSADEPPSGYSAEASQWSSDPPRPAPESGPRPFP